MFDDFKAAIASQLSELTGASPEIITAAIEIPKSNTHGDLAVTIPRLRIKGAPTQQAKEWAEAFVPDQKNIIGVVATGPYINFRINREAFSRSVLSTVFKTQEKFGWTNDGAGKRVIVEFSSPNIAKSFHAGHLRSTIIGNFIYRLYKANGWDAISMNYLGDWGKQYGLLAVGFDRFGNEERLAEDPILHLYDVYVAINAAAKDDDSIHDEARLYFRRMEDGDETALALWRRFRDFSIAKYKDTYARLGVHFDVYSGESQVGEGMTRAMDMLAETGLLVESDGAKLVDLEKYKLGKAVVQKRDGTTLYLTRDIGAAIERYETYNFDKIIYVVASQQDQHLKQLFKTLELLGLPYANRFQHVNYGMVNGMSTRRGTVVFLDDMLQDCKDNMHAVMRKDEDKYNRVSDPEHTADVLGISAMIVQDMIANRIKDYDFNWKRILSYEGATGPYVQYTHTRLCSIERKAELEITDNVDYSHLTGEAAHEIISLVSQYPDILASALRSLEPCTVVQYMLALSRAVSSALEVLRVLRQPDVEVSKAYLLTFWSARVVLGNALTLIGLEPLTRM
ncbi:arginyl-tRNA synthetase [Coemansia thaxteri]|uniref:arginine--tRNA ligase n=1 Tax=Coemansia thaxteri TaxID=2663907 RepID=A0A9W8ELZ7_9FUNG|nr:arginyl-tRNA synthetase [Coemansia thaxteri]KAJ2009687.1 arginyl-tRNA synthetase [Coemansia thaxteri]KAJ2474336.1 arginyl-tRNA synthetase [Coemansia sp. RSA 2322]KAJ2486220.1 arginyl-tRNA synthetase [Coemansia sp. RSA 2320]